MPPNLSHQSAHCGAKRTILVPRFLRSFGRCHGGSLKRLQRLDFSLSLCLCMERIEMSARSVVVSELRDLTGITIRTQRDVSREFGTY